MKRIAIYFLFIFFISNSPLYSQDYKLLESYTTKVAQEIGKTVVSITAASSYGGPEEEILRRFFEDFFGNIPNDYGRFVLGSGFIIDKDGYILTNAHVVSGAKEIRVTLYDGNEYNAILKGKDLRTDLAIIKIEASNLPVAKLGDSNNLRIGQFVMALGNPFGISTQYQNPQPTVTLGVVSALHRYLPVASGRASFEDLIQTDAAINPGNSGGPLVNLDGEVIGVNAAIITRSGGYEGVGFAIPINKAKRILNRLIRGEKVLYGWLGVSIQNLNDDLRSYFGIEEKKGVIVVKVFKDSPADKAGLKEGDLIISFNSQPVNDSRTLVSLVTESPVGKVVPIEILRNRKEIRIDIKIGARPEGIEKVQAVEITTFRGMEIEDLTPYLKQRFRIKEKEGVIIVSVDDGSPAQKAGLQIGDLIIRIGDKRIRNKDDFEKAILGIKGNCLVKTNRGYFVLKEE